MIGILISVSLWGCRERTHLAIRGEYQSLTWRLLWYNTVRLLDGRLLFIWARGKSGQHRTRQSLTATRGNSRESATETIPLPQAYTKYSDW